MNDITEWIDNKAELKAVMEQIAGEYPEGHRIRKMTERIVTAFKKFTGNLQHRQIAERIFAGQEQAQYFPLNHEAECLNSYFRCLCADLDREHRKVKTPPAIKGLVTTLLKIGREFSIAEFQRIKEAHSKAEVERDPYTSKARKKVKDEQPIRYGALINVKVSNLKQTSKGGMGFQSQNE